MAVVCISFLMACHGDPAAVTGIGDETIVPRGSFAIHVVEYRPAPGQFVQRYGDSTRALGIPDGQVVTLGGLGGSITVRFAHPIHNRPGPDFVVWGNALYRAGDVQKRWAEPAVIEVSDTGSDWLVIKGSLFSSGRPEIYIRSMTYLHTNDAVWPGVFSGMTNLVVSCHDLTAVFSNHLSVVDGWSWTNGTVAQDGMWGHGDSTPPNLPLDEFWTMDDPLRLGAQGAGGDSIDLDWARTPDGSFPPAGRLTNIRYLRLTSAVHLHAGELGEFSTEVDAIGVPW